MKRLIYTAVFQEYDRVYPPVARESDVDHVIFTDDTAMRVAGWRTIPVDMSRFATPSAANRYYKTLIHREMPDYDASLYLDGNIRLLGVTKPLFDRMTQTGADVALFPHPLRSNVTAEVETVIARGKVPAADALRAELAAYKAQGFRDDIGLTENTIMLKNHHGAHLDEAMGLWWRLYETYLSRDQVSFPYVVWKTGLKIHHLPGSFRDPNPWFAIYPHMKAKGVNPRYAHVSARSHDSLAHKALLALWHAQWGIRRALRKGGVV